MYMCTMAVTFTKLMIRFASFIIKIGWGVGIRPQTSFILPYSPYYAEACNEFAEPISAS